MTAQSATAMQPTIGVATVKQSSGDLFEQFDKIYESVSRRAYEVFEQNGRQPGNDLGNWLRAEAETLHPVHLTMRESADNITVEVEVPGFAAKDLQIHVEQHRLRIAGKRESKREETKGKVIRSEWCADQIFRVIDLPADVDASKVNASLGGGILTISLPKDANAALECKSKGEAGNT